MYGSMKPLTNRVPTYRLLELVDQKKRKPDALAKQSRWPGSSSHAGSDLAGTRPFGSGRSDRPKAGAESRNVP